MSKYFRISLVMLADFVSILLPSITKSATNSGTAEKTGDYTLLRMDEIAGCPLFPYNNIWNARVDSLPLDPLSDEYIQNMSPNQGVHPDFGSGTWDGAPIGIPYNVVPPDQQGKEVTFEYSEESDHGPYPIPANPKIEVGPESEGDRHILIVQQEKCLLYELYDAWPQSDGTWYAGSGAIYDLRSNALRPDTWTSADAAGLPILPGLVRYEEVNSGTITHALRFTTWPTRNYHVWPARHDASADSDPYYPPMGQRFRLKSSFDISEFSPEVQVILIALKQYGMMLADNGAPWYITGAPDENWDNETLVTELRKVKGFDFEAVDVSSLMVDKDSGRVREYNLMYIHLPFVVLR